MRRMSARKLSYLLNPRYNRKNVAPNKFEQSMYDILNLEGIIFEREYIIPGTSKVYDVYLPTYQTLIEFDGDYWHPENLDEAKSRMQKKNFYNDKRKDKLAEKYGYKLIRIRQSEKCQSIKELL